MTIAFSVLLDSPVERLYEYLADPRNRTEWQSSLIWLEMHSDGQPHVGMKWQEKARGLGVFSMEISELVPLQRWSERGRSARGEINLRLQFDPATDQKTQVRVQVDLSLRGLAGKFQRFAPLFLRPLMAADLRRAARMSAQGP